MTDNLKLPEPFVWIAGDLVKGLFEWGGAFISCEDSSEILFTASSRNSTFNTEEVRTILKAMEVVEATIKARNQPN